MILTRLFQIFRAPAPQGMRVAFLLALLLACALPAPVCAQEIGGADDDGTQATLLSATTGVGEASELWLGLDISMNEGWHTYWRTPGEVGTAPVLDWTQSLTPEGNLTGTSLLFPAPHRLMMLGIESIGYENHVLFPIKAQLAKPGEPLHVRAHLHLLVCKELCLPRSLDLALDVPQGAATPSPDAAKIDAARARVPTAENDALKIAPLERGEASIKLTATRSVPFVNPELFVENARDLSFAPPAPNLSDDKKSVSFTLAPVSALPAGVSLKDLPLTLTLADDGAALEVQDPRAQISPSKEAAPASPSLVFALFAGLLGGLLLNLMPCVLPILSLKIMGVLRHGGGEKSAVRRSFLASALGIWTSFFALGLTLMLLRMGGQNIGWGVQFQHPAFLTFLILILTLFAANLWGLFQISLPSWLMGRLGAAGTPGTPSLKADFFSGVFATLLATPCSAPFLGTALVFALASSMPAALAVFVAMGLGMALPYFVLAAMPGFATRLPKPGAWMETLRRLLALALGATIVWLLFVLQAQNGGGATALGAIIGLLLIFFLNDKTSVRQLPLWPLTSRIFGVLFVLLAFVSANLPSLPTQDTTEAGWQRFDEAALTLALSHGKTVFVDVGADWCLTCKANERLTLTQREIAKRLLGDPNLVAMKADWTRPDPAITDFLKRHGRMGVPFSAVFSPQRPGGLVLPELLTPAIVLEALDKSSSVCQTGAVC